MLMRLILLCGAVLLGLKIFAPHRLRAFGRQVDRGVNLTLIGLGLVYTVQLALYFFSR
jgi:hypothetical protein